MRNLVYQYWDGPIPQGVEYNIDLVKDWAERIGAEYRFDHNTKFFTGIGKASHFYGTLKPVYDDSFLEYDNVLYLDCDVFPIKDESPFENLQQYDIAMAKELFQPKQRKKFNTGICSKQDEIWATVIKKNWRLHTLPKCKDGLEIFNAGVVLYSNKGLKIAREKFIPIIEYINIIKKNKIHDFYTHDQNYLHANVFGGIGLLYCFLDKKWNSIIHPYWIDSAKTKLDINDERTDDTVLVHIQLKKADYFSDDLLHSICHDPIEVWRNKI